MSWASRMLPGDGWFARRLDLASWQTLGLGLCATIAGAAALTVDHPLTSWLCPPLALALVGLAVVTEAASRRTQALQRTVEHLKAHAQRSEMRWQDLDVMVPVARFEWLPEGDRWWGDAALYRLLGLAPKTLPTSTGLLERFVHPDDVQSVRRALALAGAEGGWLDCRCRLIRDDGALRHVRVRGRPHAGGGVRRITGVVADLTDQVRTTDELLLARAALDLVDQPVSAVDDRLNYRLHNRAWFDTTGVSPRHQGQVHFNHVFPLVTSPERREAFAACQRDGRERVVRGHNPAAPRSGQVFETRYVRFDAPDASWRGVLMVSRDLTPPADHKPARADGNASAAV